MVGTTVGDPKSVRSEHREDVQVSLETLETGTTRETYRVERESINGPNEVVK